MENTGKVRNVVLWIVSIAVGLLFIASGAGKLANPAGAAKLFAHFGYAAWFVTVIGLVEVLGGIGLLIPRVARWAAIVLGVVMLGAACSHLRVGEWGRVGFTVGLLVALGFIACARGKRATA
jgi:uncharacterized membrane protein YphA (DoxX/SURF4 family)